MSVVSSLPLVAVVVLSLFGSGARAQASQASALSALPIGVLSVAPAAVLASGVQLTLVAVEVSADGTVWVLKRVADGGRATVRLAGHASAVVGTQVAVSVVATGHVLSAAGRALAFVPNETGAALLYSERVTP